MLPNSQTSQSLSQLLFFTGFNYHVCFLNGAFSFSGKMLDSYSDLFLQITDLTLIGPLFVQKLLKLLRLLKLLAGQVKLSAKGPLAFFFTFLKVTYKTGRD